MNQDLDHMGDVALTALAPLAWGTTYWVATEMLPPGYPLWVAALRSLPVGLLLGVALRKLPHGVWWGRMLVLGILNIGIFQALLFVAAYRLPGGVAATAGAIQPLVVVLLSAWLGRSRPTLGAIALAIAGLGGMALLVLGPAARLDAVGIVAALGGAVAMGLGTVLVQRWGRPVSLLVFTAWQLTVGGVFLLPIAILWEGWLPPLTLTQVQGLLYLGLVGTGLAYVLWFRGVGRLAAVAVSYLGLLSPVMAALVGFLGLQQSLTGTQLVGMGIIFASVLGGSVWGHSGGAGVRRLRSLR